MPEEVSSRKAVSPGKGGRVHLTTQQGLTKHLLQEGATLKAVDRAGAKAQKLFLTTVRRVTTE